MSHFGAQPAKFRLPAQLTRKFGLDQGATGTVLSNKEIPGTDNQSDIVVRIKHR